MNWTKLEELVVAFSVGDVVHDEDRARRLGIVTEVGKRSVAVVWDDGSRAMGPGLVPSLRHHDPRLRVQVPKGALGYRWWNRQQSIKAALRRAGA